MLAFLLRHASRHTDTYTDTLIAIVHTRPGGEVARHWIYMHITVALNA